MSTSIYWNVEVWKPDTRKWVPVPEPPEWDYDNVELEEYDSFLQKEYPYWYEWQNYYVFGALAGVRYYGLGPIRQPRGLPADVSDLVKERYDEGEYFFRPSWYTARELREGFERLDGEHTACGCISLKDYENEVFPPKDVYDYVDGDGCITISESTAKDMLAGLVLPIEGKKYFVDAQWDEPLGELCGDFMRVTIPGLCALASERGVIEDDVRVVFWFC